MLTYQNITKEEAVRRAKEHRDQDRLIAGTYYRNGTTDWKGCSIGCDVKDKNGGHAKWAELYGTPEWLPRLIDRLFERLHDISPAEARDWHVAVREAIPAGVDVSSVGPLHASRCLARCVDYVGEGDEPWRVKCREAVGNARDITATGRWLTDADAAWAADAARAADAAWTAWTAWTARAADAADAAWARCAADAVRATRAAEAARAAWTADAADAAWARWAADAARATRAAWTADAADATRAADAARARWAAEIHAQRDDLVELLKACEPRRHI